MFCFRTAALAGVLIVIAAAAGAEDTDVDSVRAKLEALRQRIESIEADLKVEVSRRDALAAALGKAEAATGAAARRLHEAGQALQQVNARLRVLQDEQAALELAHGAQRKKLAASVRAAYFMGREAKLKLLLNQEDLAAGARLMAYFRYLNRARLEQLDLINSQLAQLAQIEHEIAQKKARLAALQQTRRRQLAAEQQGLKERALVLARIEGRIASQGEQISLLTRDEKALEALLARLERALASIEDIPAQLAVPFTALKGKLPWPLEDPAQIGPEAPGFLLGAETGTPVHAIAAGRVAFADWLRGYGLLVILDHGEGYMSLYAHNHSLLRDVGEWVTAGAVISLVGKSGGREKAGLYFEVRHEAEPVSLIAWLEQKNE